MTLPAASDRRRKEAARLRETADATQDPTIRVELLAMAVNTRPLRSQYRILEPTVGLIAATLGCDFLNGSRGTLCSSQRTHRHLHEGSTAAQALQPVAPVRRATRNHAAPVLIAAGTSSPVGVFVVRPAEKSQEVWTVETSPALRPRHEVSNSTIAVRSRRRGVHHGAEPADNYRRADDQRSEPLLKLEIEPAANLDRVAVPVELIPVVDPEQANTRYRDGFDIFWPPRCAFTIVHFAADHPDPSRPTLTSSRPRAQCSRALLRQRSSKLRSRQAGPP